MSFDRFCRRKLGDFEDSPLDGYALFSNVALNIIILLSNIAGTYFTWKFMISVLIDGNMLGFGGWEYDNGKMVYDVNFFYYFIRIIYGFAVILFLSDFVMAYFIHRRTMRVTARAVTPEHIGAIWLFLIGGASAYHCIIILSKNPLTYVIKKAKLKVRIWSWALSGIKTVLFLAVILTSDLTKVVLASRFFSVRDAVTQFFGNNSILNQCLNEVRLNYHNTFYPSQCNDLTTVLEAFIVDLLLFALAALFLLSIVMQKPRSKMTQPSQNDVNYMNIPYEKV
ncbi:hypothetical protein BC830DRAFT_1171320 [Chytriomyces sp. MP71]|nr:hypothetical protein BC830DRAFT_1171320 [Chytriomyces sp. MP71]